MAGHKVGRLALRTEFASQVRSAQFPRQRISFDATLRSSCRRPPHSECRNRVEFPAVSNDGERAVPRKAARSNRSPLAPPEMPNSRSFAKGRSCSPREQEERGGPANARAYGTRVER